MDTIPNGEELEFPRTQKGSIPNGHNSEWLDTKWTRSRVDIITNGHNPKWKRSQMDRISIGYLYLYNYLGVVHVLVRIRLQRL